MAAEVVEGPRQESLGLEALEALAGLGRRDTTEELAGPPSAVLYLSVLVVVVVLEGRPVLGELEPLKAATVMEARVAQAVQRLEGLAGLAG